MPVKRTVIEPKDNKSNMNLPYPITPWESDSTKTGKKEIQTFYFRRIGQDQILLIHD